MLLKPAFLGIDIGTQGVRAMAMLENGECCANHSRSFSKERFELLRQEQDPEEWWDLVEECLKQVTADLERMDDTILIQAITVSSTSGTVIPLDKDHKPLHKAIMYSDQRSSKAAAICRMNAEQAGMKGYTAFASSSSLSSIVWFQQAFPDISERVYRWVHAADFIVGRLSGVWDVTDETNSLKTGYDLIQEEWPDYLQRDLGLSRSQLPQVVPTGTLAGRILKEVAEQTGLPVTTKVTVGVTDSCASQIASGAIQLGDWNTTIGSTLVLKGVTKRPILDPKHRIYNHKHPDGYWMPGGASNTGADWVTVDFSGHDLNELNRQATELIPTNWLAYPLLQQGERFPFIADHAQGFEPEGLSIGQKYAARMEGTAYMERLSYELIEKLSGERAGTIYTAGGASNSRTWLKIRSHVMGVPMIKMKHASSAAGAAILAASKTYYSSLPEAGQYMLVSETIIEPESSRLQERYSELYECFVDALTERGYVTSE